MEKNFNFELDQDGNSTTCSQAHVDFNCSSSKYPIIDDSDFIMSEFPNYVCLDAKNIMSVHEPKPGFIVIVNSDGDIVDHLSSETKFEEINELVQYLDQNFNDKSPHSSWSCNGSFERII